MDVKPRSWEKVRRLLEKGLQIPNPLSIDIGEEVDLNRISGQDVILYPGCRIYGAKTVISAGCKLGYEAPVTLNDCALGPKVELKGGFFSGAAFLEKANMGLGAQVREGTLLEEEANGAHCVGLKQTILFPFVTLGSLINFCDCLMAGGTSRKNHSEVGSSYIHFNYTPSQDKATASLIGDVPRGVMLNRPPIFLGGQGGLVGPLRLGFGAIVAAGAILRSDHPEDGQLIAEAAPEGNVKAFVPAAYPRLGRILRNNILFIANLAALTAWYRQVRKPFFAKQELGELVYNGALEQLSSAKAERLKRLQAVAGMVVSPAARKSFPEQRAQRQAFADAVSCLEELLAEGREDETTRHAREAFLADFQKRASDGKGYIETIQQLPPDVSGRGVAWLEGIVAHCVGHVAKTVPSVDRLKE